MNKLVILIAVSFAAPIFAGECDAFNSLKDVQARRCLPAHTDSTGDLAIEEQGLVCVSGSTIVNISGKGKPYRIRYIDGFKEGPCYDLEYTKTNTPGVRRVDRLDQRGLLVYYSIQTFDESMEGEYLDRYEVFTPEGDLVFSADLSESGHEYLTPDGQTWNSWCEVTKHAKYRYVIVEDRRVEKPCAETIQE